MDQIIPETSLKKNIACPYCKKTLYIPNTAQSIHCSHCNQQINLETSITSNHTNKREIICFKCGKEIQVDKNAQAVMCKYCYNRNDLSSLKIKTIFGAVLQTYGQLYLQKKGSIKTSVVQVGSAIIRGSIEGNITAYGTVEILKNGEVIGDITCRNLIVKKGGTFVGHVHLLNPGEFNIQ